MKTNTELAREAGIRDCTCDGTRGCLERFAALVRAEAQAEEREAMLHLALFHGAPWSFQEAIRARGNT